VGMPRAGQVMRPLNLRVLVLVFYLNSRSNLQSVNIQVLVNDGPKLLVRPALAHDG
jgi:hypothetical protein